MDQSVTGYPMIFHLSSQERPRALAKSLKSIIRAMGGGITLSSSQSVVARMLGHRDWHDLSKSIGTAPPSLDDAFCEEEVVLSRNRQQVGVLMALGYEKKAAGRIVEELHPTNFTRPAPIAPVVVPWPWKDGPPVFRSLGGDALAYEPMSYPLNTFSQLVYDTSGKGWVSFASTTVRSLLRSTTHESQVRIGMVSTGPVPEGTFISADGSRSDVAEIRLENSRRSAVNHFDTHLGCRYPTPTEENSSIFFVLHLVQSYENTSSIPGMAHLVSMVIRKTYALLSDDHRAARPKWYSAAIDERVDGALDRFGIENRVGALWWDIVDLLFAEGDIASACAAQRRATPLLVDMLEASYLPDIEEAFGTAKSSDGRSLLAIFRESISATIGNHPVLSVPTKIDLDDHPFAVIDIGSASTKDGKIDSRLSGTMLFLARFLLTRSRSIDESMLSYSVAGKPFIPVAYMNHHGSRIQARGRIRDLVIYRDMQQFAGSQEIEQLVTNDIRNSRKFDTGVVAISGSLEFFSKDMRDLVSSCWVLDVPLGAFHDDVAGIFSIDIGTIEAFSTAFGPGPVSHLPILARTYFETGRADRVMTCERNPVPT